MVPVSLRNRFTCYINYYLCISDSIYQKVDQRVEELCSFCLISVNVPFNYRLQYDVQHSLHLYENNSDIWVILRKVFKQVNPIYISTISPAQSTSNTPTIWSNRQLVTSLPMTICTNITPLCQCSTQDLDSFTGFLFTSILCSIYCYETQHS